MACTVRFLLQEKKAQIYWISLLNTHFCSTGFFCRYVKKLQFTCRISKDSWNRFENPAIIVQIYRVQQIKRCPWKRRRKLELDVSWTWKKCLWKWFPHRHAAERGGGKGTSADCIWRRRRRRRGKLHENKNSRAKKRTESSAQSHLKQLFSRAEGRVFKAKTISRKTRMTLSFQRPAAIERVREKEDKYISFWSPQDFFSSSRRRKKL